MGRFNGTAADPQTGGGGFRIALTDISVGADALKWQWWFSI